ncbi:SNF2 family N-terminal domain-containing protein [Xylariaceae sp. FL0804]|nr:SNF2 family N-terminal domain-containing protein [Xylariaceae sp. FL0804]
MDGNLGPHMSEAQLLDARELYGVLLSSCNDADEREEYDDVLITIGRLLDEKQRSAIPESSYGHIANPSSRKRNADALLESPRCKQQRAGPSSASDPWSDFVIDGQDPAELMAEQQAILDRIAGERDAQRRSEALAKRLQDEEDEEDGGNDPHQNTHHDTLNAPTDSVARHMPSQPSERSMAHGEAGGMQVAQTQLNGSHQYTSSSPPSSASPSASTSPPSPSSSGSRYLSGNGWPGRSLLPPLPSFTMPRLPNPLPSSAWPSFLQPAATAPTSLYMPGAQTPQSHASLPGFSQIAAGLPRPPNVQNSAPVYGQPAPSQSTANPFSGFGGGLNVSNSHGQAGPSDLSAGEPNYDADFEDMIRDRGLSGLLADPSRTREDLQKLLENIGPDEDLPEELRANTPPAMSCTLLPYQRVGLTWLKKQEESSHKGGILADGMGLGKTIQAIALMLERPPTDPRQRTTLIVVPVALLKQWPREIEQRINPAQKLSCYVFHGAGRKNMSVEKLLRHDVVVTNYDTLGHEYKRLTEWRTQRSRNPRTVPPKQVNVVLLDKKAKFHRIILDEAHNIKNRHTKAAHGCSAVQATYRLCMTGTPMQNNTEELYSLIRFLRIPPYCVWETFNRDIAKPLKARMDFGRESGMRRLHALIKSTLLQRTKNSKMDGRLIIQLPERMTHVAAAEFDRDQQDFYTSLEHKTQLTVNKYLKAGTVGKNYQNILVLLLRLRQACCHPHLIRDHGIPVGAETEPEEMVDLATQLAPQTVRRIKEQEAFDCPVCLDAVTNPTILFPCGHDLCGECFSSVVDGATRTVVEAKCPECRGKLNPKQVISYSLFMKAWMPDKYRQEYPEDAGAAPEEDSETDTEDDDDEANSQGNLDGFIVADDEVESETASQAGEDVEAKDSDTDESLFVRDDHDDDESESDVTGGRRSRKGKGKQTATSIKATTPRSSTKSKGKGKAKSSKAKSGKKTFTSLADLKRASMRNAKAKRRYLKRLQRDYTSSAKIDKTMELLESIKQNDPSTKTIIFSQFTSFLDLLEIPISRAEYGYKRYDGSMSSTMRDEAVVEFTEKPDVNIMLISLKAGNAGLNLNVASEVIILDPFWNPFIEEQAIDRAHRIGQRRNVNVHRVLVAGTVEDRILALQDKKRALVEEALSEEGARSVSRLGVRELAYLFGITPSA